MQKDKRIIPPPRPKLMNKKVNMLICTKKLIQPNRQDIKTMRKPNFIPLDLWFALDSKYKKSVHKPRNNPHPNILTAEEKEVGFACKKCSRPDIFPLSKANRTELICIK